MKLATSSDAEQAFYQAFERLDLQAMGALWADGEDTACLHPGGALIRGTQAVIQSWAEIFAGADPPGIDHRLISQRESGVLAVHLVEERIRPHRSATGSLSRVIATNVYLLDGDGWRMLSHHASVPLMAGRGERLRPTMH